MSRATLKRASIKNKIVKIGGTASLYSYSSATKTTNAEGDVTITWGSASSFYFISENHYTFRRLLEMQGIESNQSERRLIVPYDAGVGQHDKVVIGTEAYIVNEINPIDPIEGIALMYIIVLGKDERYVV